MGWLFTPSNPLTQHRVLCYDPTMETTPCRTCLRIFVTHEGIPPEACPACRAGRKRRPRGGLLAGPHASLEEGQHCLILIPISSASALWSWRQALYRDAKRRGWRVKLTPIPERLIVVRLKVAVAPDAPEDFRLVKDVP